MPFLWTELEFTVDIPEGITLRTYLTTEKDNNVSVIYVYLFCC